MEKIFQTFLEKLPQGINPYSHDKVFGTPHASEIPNIDFTVSPLPPIILDQSILDFCTGEASSSINTVASWADFSLVDYMIKKGLAADIMSRAALAYKYSLVGSAQQYVTLASGKLNAAINLQILANLIQENGDDFDPLWQFSKIKQIRGEWTGYGANLHDACMALVKYGSLPRSLSPFTFNAGKDTDQNRDFLANWNNWPISLDTIAEQYKVPSFFQIDGPNDAFDNIRAVLWLNSSQQQGFEVMFGLNWRPEWTNVPGAIINEQYTVSSGGGHDVKFIGQKIIEGEPYLVLQNSWSKLYGDKGLYYFSRNVINTEFKTGFGAFTFKRMAANTAQAFVQNGINISDSKPVQWLKKLLTLFKEKIMQDSIHDQEVASPNTSAPTDGQTPVSLALYQTAKTCLGTSMVQQGVPIEFGCASSVNAVYRKAFGSEIGGGSSTADLYQALIQSADFEKVTVFAPGDIIISPTGHSSIPFEDNPVPNGHVGVVGLYGIMSNNSYNGLWQEKYTMDTWNDRYGKLGGYPVLFFRKK